MQGKQFRCFEKTATPLFLPKVAACCRKPKIHRDSPLARAVWGVWTTLYFCMASVPAPAFWAHLIPSSQRGIISSCTPSCSMLATASKEGCSKKDMPLSMKGAPRKCCYASPAPAEVCIPEGWRVRQAEECKNSHRVSMLSLEMLSCYQLFKSFWAVGNLLPVHMSNSRKFSNSWDEGCQFSACFTVTIPKTCLFLLKKKQTTKPKPTNKHKNQTCNHTLVCPANTQPLIHLHTK